MPAALADAVIGSYQAKQVVSTELSPNMVVSTHRFSGGAVVQQVDVTSGEPVVTVGTQDIAGFIAGLSATTGTLVSSGTVTIPVHVRAAGGLFVASGSDYSLSFTDGVAIPKTITASQDDQQGAVATFDFYGCSTDGLANPITHNTGATLAAQSFVAVHNLGPVKLNSTTCAGIKSCTVDFGFDVSVERYNGQPFPVSTNINVKEVNPFIEFTFEDAASMHAFAQILAISSTCIAFFRKSAAGGLRTAEATAEHIACTMTGGAATLQSLSAKGTDNQQYTTKVFGKTMAFSSTSAIS
jgi:hypothetical protein